MFAKTMGIIFSRSEPSCGLLAHLFSNGYADTGKNCQKEKPEDDSKDFRHHETVHRTIKYTRDKVDYERNDSAEDLIEAQDSRFRKCVIDEWERCSFEQIDQKIGWFEWHDDINPGTEGKEFDQPEKGDRHKEIMVYLDRCVP